MTTTHEYMAEETLERFMAGADGLEALRLARQGLREGKWSAEYVSVIGQQLRTPVASWPMAQVAAFAEVHALIIGGSVAEVLIGVGEVPRRDARRESNASALSCLPHPFTAEVDMLQSNDQGDGVLAWDCPIRVTLATGLIQRLPDGTTRPIPIHYTIPPGFAVLEIGSTWPSRTWSHLIEGGCRVARWPYGSKRIRLLVNLDLGTFASFRAARVLLE